MASLLPWRRKARPLRWSVVVSAPKGVDGEQWGDTWFAADLVEALNRAGQEATTVFRGGATSSAREDDDVVLVLRGLRRVVPRRSNAVWMLWVISHPELVDDDEPGEYDATFAASEHWRRAADFTVPITPLLQATNPRRFTPAAAAPDTGADVLFVGSTRGEFRPAVRYALEAGIDLSLYGVGWEQFVPPDRVSGTFLANQDLPAAYASAGVVLNDHWQDMAVDGFLSNRLFDATACGARVLSDQARGIDDVFGRAVRTYADGAELTRLLAEPRDEVFEDRAARLVLAEMVAREHSFDARARVLIERAEAVRAQR